MTDYEMFSALPASLSLLWDIFAVYVSIVFAFLVASHLAAGRLASRIVSLVITLYTLVTFWAIFGLNRTATTVAGMSAEIKRAVLESGSSLGWLSVVTLPESMFSAFPVVRLSVTLAIYAGSILFFFHQRKFN